MKNTHIRLLTVFQYNMGKQAGTGMANHSGY